MRPLSSMASTSLMPTSPKKTAWPSRETRLRGNISHQRSSKRGKSETPPRSRSTDAHLSATSTRKRLLSDPRSSRASALSRSRSRPSLPGCHESSRGWRGLGGESWRLRASPARSSDAARGSLPPRNACSLLSALGRCRAAESSASPPAIAGSMGAPQSLPTRATCTRQHADSAITRPRQPPRSARTCLCMWRHHSFLLCRVPSASGRFRVESGKSGQSRSTLAVCRSRHRGMASLLPCCGVSWLAFA